MQQQRPFTQSDEAEKPPDGRSAHVARADAVVAAVLDVGEEPGDEFRINVGDRQIRGLAPELSAGVIAQLTGTFPPSRLKQPSHDTGFKMAGRAIGGLADRFGNGPGQVAGNRTVEE